LAFGAFVAILIFGTGYGFYGQIVSGGLGAPQVAGAEVIFFIRALFVIVVALLGPPAIELVIDAESVRFSYERGSPGVRLWGAARTSIRERYFPGADDSVPRGQPVWSVYGPAGGFSETFISGTAFEELVSTARAHGHAMSERSGRTGWTLYTIHRAHS
jgi:hypothetical protein